ncbi:hypothetical protein ACFQAV_10130 [Companilactobacillus huachuanensis]|uniref:Uncharacterized protein n=1 Tax=Companilactobacillus huachuanensis TaxID=2559914 RepID=A0ABW1RNN2_9LACO|nr:hypothetical protein [Companilactobacillus huachuanensis]
MVDIVTKLNATDCFDYFVNNFDSLYKNESTYCANPTLDPEINNQNLYANMMNLFGNIILEQPEFSQFEVRFARGDESSEDFIIVTFVDPDDSSEVSLEVNRNDTPEYIEETFRHGRQTLRTTYASEVFEIKNINHKSKD